MQCTVSTVMRSLEFYPIFIPYFFNTSFSEKNINSCLLCSEEMCQDMEPEDGVFAGKAEFVLVFASSALCPFLTPDSDYNLMTV